jgi:hypothetical protein
VVALVPEPDPELPDPELPDPEDPEPLEPEPEPEDPEPPEPEPPEAEAIFETENIRHVISTLIVSMRRTLRENIRNARHSNLFD